MIIHKPHKILDFAGTQLRGRGIDPALGQGNAAPPWNPSKLGSIEF
jgi:hypothetical protein